MAWICPDCERPDAIAYVESYVDDPAGILHPFPCRHCNFSVIQGHAAAAVTAALPCGAGDCQRGWIVDIYEYSANGRLNAVTSNPCIHCKQRHFKEQPSHATDRRRRPLPDPRMRRIPL